MLRAMKKITMILAASAMILSGCVKEHISTNNKSAEIRTIRVGVNDQTKVGVHIDRDAQNDTYYWKAGDAVILCEYSGEGETASFTGNNSRFVLDAGSAESAVGTFTLADGETAPTAGGTYLAVHVRNEANLTPPDAGGAVNFAIPASLTQANGAEDVADNMLLAAQVTLVADGEIPSVTLAHKTAVVDLGITTSDATLTGATLTGVSMVAGTTDQYAGTIALDPSGAPAAAAGRTTNGVAVSAAAVLSATPYYVRLVTLMDAPVAGNVTFTFTAQNASREIYSSNVSLPSIYLNFGKVRPANVDLASPTFIATQPVITGTSISITSPEEMKWVMMANNKTLSNIPDYNGFADYTLTVANPINLGAAITTPWTSIGTSNNPFKGTFDGGSKTLSNLTGTDRGLFNMVVGVSKDSRAQVKNVVLDGVILSISLSNVGAIAGQPTFANISGCKITGLSINQNSAVTTGNLNSIGGIVGFLQNAGGFVSIKDCSVEGKIGDIKGFNTNVGGTVGQIAVSDVEIDHCSFVGELHCAANLGGIVGSTANADTYANVGITNCDVGVDDTEKPTTITTSYAGYGYTGTAIGSANCAGGIIGFAQNTDDSFIIDKCHVINATIGATSTNTNFNKANAGGIAAAIYSANISTVSNCTVTDCVIRSDNGAGNNNSAPIGGIAGLVLGTKISYCTVKNTQVTAPYNGSNNSTVFAAAGGICGAVVTTSTASPVVTNNNSTIIFACNVINGTGDTKGTVENTGNYTQSWWLGGIVGTNLATTPTYIGSSYSNIPVSGYAKATAVSGSYGGLVGFNNSADLVVEGCYNAGVVSSNGQRPAGAISGVLTNTVIVPAPPTAAVYTSATGTYTGCYYAAASVPASGTPVVDVPGTIQFATAAGTGTTPTGKGWDTAGTGPLAAFWSGSIGPWAELGDGSTDNLPHF